MSGNWEACKSSCFFFLFHACNKLMTAKMLLMMMMIKCCNDKARLDHQLLFLKISSRSREWRKSSL